MGKKQFFITIALLASIAALHYLIPGKYLALHIIFRMLYLAPIIYAGLQSGKAGGIITSATASLLFLPHFFFSHATMEFQAGNIAALILFNAAGIASGILRSSTEKKYKNYQEAAYAAPVARKAKSILFYAENSPATLFVAQWFVENFFSDPTDMVIRMIWVSHEDMEDIFESSEKAKRHIRKTGESMESLLSEAKEIFISKGLPNENIKVKKIAVHQKARTSDKICEELGASSYDLILLPKHRMTKSQEFLIGDTAIRVLRRAGAPVLAVSHDSPACPPTTALV